MYVTSGLLQTEKNENMALSASNLESVLLEQSNSLKILKM